MRTIKINLTITYTCDVCDKWFYSKEELLRKLPYVLRICSKKCEFKFIYNLIKKQGYTEQNYIVLLKVIGKEQESKELNEDLAIYDISKYYNKIGLSNIKHLGSRLIAKAQGSKNSSKAQGSFNSPPIYRGNEPEPEPIFFESHNNNMSLLNFGEKNK